MTSSESTTRRRERELADFGEIRACELLRQKGFKVERMPPNFPFFDLMATRGSCRLLVPVKTRNKIADFAQAKIFWVAVTVDAKAKIFLAYTGDVTALPSCKSIPMHPSRHVCNYKCLIKDRHDDEISET
jgi:Holliday junction resolvase-like predicted endonuclease